MNALDSFGAAPHTPGATAALGNKREERAAMRARAAAAGRAGGAALEGEELEKKVRGTAEEFVSVFMNQIMKSMRSTVNENPAMHGDNGEKFFQEMLDTEQSKTLATGSGYGLTDLIYESMMTSYRVSRPEAAVREMTSMTNAATPAGSDQSRMDEFAEDAADAAVDGVEL